MKKYETAEESIKRMEAQIRERFGDIQPEEGLNYKALNRATIVKINNPKKMFGDSSSKKTSKKK
jgi:hypothetical protein